MRQRYYGNWDDYEGLKEDFFPSWRSMKASDDFPSASQVIFAAYDTPSYEGYCFVLFQRGGKLYEVNGSHCSCYGLEGQWAPEETSWDALAMRDFANYDSGGERDALVALIQSRRAVAAKRTKAKRAVAPAASEAP